MLKKVCALFLSSILTLGMSACSNGSSSAPASENNSPETSSESNFSGTASEGSGSLKNKKIAFISPGSQFDFFVYIEAEVKKKAKEQGVHVDYFNANADATKCSDLLTQAVLQKYDAIIAAPIDTKALVPAIQQANKANIPVINYDAFISGVDLYARVGSSNEDMGKQAGEYAAKYLKDKNGEEKGNIIVLGYPALETMNKRIAGFKEALEQYPDIKIEDEIVTQSTAEGGQKLTDDLLISHQKNTVDMIYGSNAGVSLGALSSLSSAGRREIALIGIDNEAGQLQALKDGTFYKATIAQDSYAIGDNAFQAAIDAMNGKKSGDVVVPGVLVTSKNVDEYTKEDNAKKAELKAYK